MNEDDEIHRLNSLIEIGIAGLWRFYDDGFVRWPRGKLASLFSNIDLENPRVKQAIADLQARGLIRFVGRDDCYIEVLSAP